MMRRKRYFPKKENVLKGTPYDSMYEKRLHETVLCDCKFHESDKVHYSIPHTYEPDFQYEKDGKVFLIEAKARFRDSAEARKYTYVRETLPENTELVFIMEKPSVTYPFAKKRKDGTKMTHEEYLEKHGFRYWSAKDFSLDLL